VASSLSRVGFRCRDVATDLRPQIDRFARDMGLLQRHHPVRLREVVLPVEPRDELRELPPVVRPRRYAGRRAVVKSCQTIVAKSALP
jgi:hypothetical protein